MRILRVVPNYWPCVGGSERRSLLHDHWFSEVAGDDVRVIVLRSEVAFEFPGYKQLLHDFRDKETFKVPGLPKVHIHQEIFPSATRLRLVRLYWNRLRRHVSDPETDLVITQIPSLHAVPCWRGKPVVFEPTSLICPYGSHQTCSRSRFMCRSCFKEGGLDWWMRDQMLMLAYSRFDLVVHHENVYKDLKRVGFESKHHGLRFIIDRPDLLKPPSNEKEIEQKRTVDTLAAKFPHVLFQFNRLFPFKNPHLLLDVAERLPECAVVFAGDGPDKESLEQRTRGSKSLAERVRFLGPVNVASLGSISERVSAFVLTSLLSNYNTALCESMALGWSPVVAVDTNDYPAKFDEEELIFRVSPEPSTMARQLRSLLNDRARATAIARAGRRYIEENHSIDQMRVYRNRLLTLVQEYKSKRR